MIALLLGVALASELEGTWRLEMAVRSEAQVPVVRRATSVTTTLGLVTVRRDGATLVHEQVVCTVSIDDGNPLARTTLSDALVAALPETVATIDAAGDRYVVDLGESHLGYDPDLTDALPTDPLDRAVVDTEHDGRPGATVTVAVTGLGRFGIDVVQRSRAVLDGRVDGDAIAGTVRTVDFAQVVLDADAAFLRHTPEITHDDARSTFTMARVPPGTTCADLGR